ncbi:MAG: glycoside hydrolase family 2 [Lachnospiraceae bacterium]|nr:glycoside hydrolase family 2 [Lachnospiraceae bacterium]
MDTKRILLSADWRFHYGDCPEAWYAGYDDRSWERVTLPHDFAVCAPFSEEHASGTGYLRGGTAWYRVRFVIPEECRGRSVRIAFDGVYKNSQVWCNSCYLGKRPSGYAPFSYDITHCARFGQEGNVLCVRVSHEDISDSRWYTGSGITRPVMLIVEERVHPADGGVFFYTGEIDLFADDAERPAPARAKKAALHLRVCLKNDSDTEQTAEILAGLEPVLSKDRAAYGYFAKPSGPEDPISEDRFRFPAETVTIPPHGETVSVLSGTILSPRLWSPKDPQLYSLSVALKGKGGSYLAVRFSVGIRDLRFDPDQGFFLNGIPTKLRGVCVHEDAGCLGAAVPREVWERRLELLKACGTNAIRMSHNPHADELYTLCDEMGFFVMDEAFDEWENPKNKWWHGHNVYPPRHQGSYEDFPAWHETDLRAMVRRGRNHPSIILWSIGNEIDYPNDPYCHPMFGEMTGNNDANKPAAERRFDPDKPNMERLAVIARELAAIVRDEDNTREVTIAAAFPELSTRIGFIDAIRVVGYNYREQFYTEDHARFPDKVFLGSENGHGEEAWRAVADNGFICGQFLWTGIDYLGEAHGWPVHGSPAGLLTTAGFPKARYFERKRIWADSVAEDAGNDRFGSSDENRDPGDPAGGSESAVREYPDADGWRITIEGTSAEDDGRADTDPAARCRAVFWRPLRADAGKEAGERWRKRTEETGFVGQILISLVDADDLPVRDHDRVIAVRVEGPGELIGLDNGDLSDNTPFTETARRTTEGNLAAYVRRTGEGAIGITVTEKENA